jgi:RHS repeat-associated protein
MSSLGKLKNRFSGNILMFDDSTQFIQGMPHSEAMKKGQTIRDLGWLDFMARMYANDEIPIFTTQDSLAEKFYSWSSYNYCMNNPLRFIDPNGEDFWDAIKDAGKWTWNNIAKPIARGTGNTILFAAGVGQLIVGAPVAVVKNGNFPEWAIPRQFDENFDLKIKYSWMKETLDWEDGKDVIKGVFNTITTFAPISSAATGTERFIENTAVSTTLSLGADAVLPSQNKSANTESNNEENNNANNNNNAWLILLINKALEQHFDNIMHNNYINDNDTFKNK